MKQVLVVFIGGGIGSAVRYLLSRWLNNLEAAIPYGTLLSNVVGSLIIGFVLGYVAKSTSFSETQTLLLATGFCGGFTTFSAFVFENYAFLKSGDYLNFISYTLGSIVLGLLAVFIGLYFSKLI